MINNEFVTNSLKQTLLISSTADFKQALPVS